MACPGITEKQLVDAANIVFQGAGSGFPGLANAYSNFDDYWELGHSFDTIVDYFVNVSPDAKKAAGFAQTVLERYQSSQTNACWYDDYGWWGIAALRASQHQKLFGDAAADFAKICFEKGNPRCCWTVMDAKAPNVWQNNQNDPRFAVLKPRFDGGIWNADWTQPDECGLVGTLPGFHRIAAATINKATISEESKTPLRTACIWCSPRDCSRQPTSKTMALPPTASGSFSRVGGVGT